jgi:hypothetical protein
METEPEDSNSIVMRHLKGRIERLERRVKATEAQRSEAWRMAEELRSRAYAAVVSLQRQAYRTNGRFKWPALTEGFSLDEGQCRDCGTTGGVLLDGLDGSADYCRDDDDYADPRDGADSWCESCLGVGHTLSINDIIDIEQ